MKGTAGCLQVTDPCIGRGKRRADTRQVFHMYKKETGLSRIEITRNIINKNHSNFSLGTSIKQRLSNKLFKVHLLVTGLMTHK